MSGKAKVGRPTDYNMELAKEICEVVATTPLMLEEICPKYPHFPHSQTIYKWRVRHPEFGSMYEKAKQAQIEPLVSSILELARNSSEDFYDDGTGKKCVNSARMSRMRMEIDTIKWFAAKLAPKLYGAKIEEGESAANSLIEKLIDKL